MVDYVSLAATAKRLIDANGRTVILRKRDRAPADPAEPWRGPGTTDTDVTVKAVVFPFDAEDVDGEQVRRKDKQAFASADSVAAEQIENFDFLVDGSDTLKIVQARVINPGDIRVLYVLQLRA